VPKDNYVSPRRGLRVHYRKEFFCHGYELAWLHADWLTIQVPSCRSRWWL